MKGRLRLLFEVLVLTVLLATFTRTWLVQGLHIGSRSMEPALLPGDHVLVNRFIFRPPSPRWLAALLPARAPRRGEIVAFDLPRAATGLLVKRCIGLPGDRIRVDRARVLLDGKPLEEEYLKERTGPARPQPSAAAPGRRIPAGSFFVLGDRRGDSLDSRVFGPIRQRDLAGKPLLIYWSWRPRGASETGGPGPPRSAFPFSFSATRWGRAPRWVR